MRQYYFFGIALGIGLLVACSSKDFKSGDGGNGGNDNGNGGWSDSYPWPRGDARYDGRYCGEANFDVSRGIPDMVIVLDRSNSMDDTTPPLWDSCRNAIYDVTSSLDTSIWFGLFIFPNSVGDKVCLGTDYQCEAPSAPVVDVGTGTAGQIKTALTNTPVCGGTPTAATLNAVKTYLASKQDNHNKYVLLATDGGPNCNATILNPWCPCTSPPVAGVCPAQNCLDDTATYNALDGLRNAGIKTYVIGLSSDTSLATVLANMATHGGTNQPYAPTDPAAIKKAFGDIAAVVASCTFDMDCSQIQDPGLVNFYFGANGDQLVRYDTGHTNGWDWTTRCVKNTPGKGTVEFFGAACDAIRNGSAGKVGAKFGCPSKIQ
jgi:hypothetical protein